MHPSPSRSVPSSPERSAPFLASGPRSSSSAAPPWAELGLEGERASRWLAFLAPEIEEAHARLTAGARRLAAVPVGAADGTPPFDLATIGKILFAHLPGRLLATASRTLVLELQIARLEERLEGESPQERCENFMAELGRRENARALLREYPVLAQRLRQSVDQWLAGSLEFLHRLTMDWDELCQVLELGDPGPLVEARGQVSDPHRGGRRVLLLRFASGARAVYKPKSVAAEAGYQNLVRQTGKWGFEPRLESLRVLERGAWGWVEHVAGAPCSSVAQVRRFFERQGAHLALLYALEATDFHQENVIAAGEHPFPIDLEALFHPRVDVRDPRTAGADSLASSVLRVGLLPQRLQLDPNGEAVDLSGLGSRGGGPTPQPVLMLEANDTDQMSYVLRHGRLPETDNLPRLFGEDVDVLSWGSSLATGFARMYELLAEHRAELLRDDGPLAAFTDAEVRVIVRPTRAYALMLQESCHPHKLRDAARLERFYDRLRIAARERPRLLDLVPAERRGLLQGDVPIFTTRPRSRCLWSGDGERFAGFFAESGLERVRRRLRRLGEEDLGLQLRLIKGALEAARQTRRETRWPSYGGRAAAAAAAPPPAPERLVEKAREIADRLAEEAVPTLGAGDEEQVTWFRLEAASSQSWVFEPVGFDLYGGLPGIALFLAELGRITREERWTELARGATRRVLAMVRDAPARVGSVGGMSGWGGLLYALPRLAELLAEPRIERSLEPILDAVAEKIDEDVYDDLIAGNAGGSIALLRLHERRCDARSLALARRCGDRLVERARPMETGVGWVREDMAPRPLTGFSHGAAGIAWALLELAAASGVRRYRETALAGIAYERSLFDAVRGNWPDLRDRDKRSAAHGQESDFLCAWCHGAPGIGLARLASLPLLDGPEVRREIATAVATTLEHGFGHNHCLCHGDLGNLSFLADVARTLDDAELRQQVGRLSGVIVDSLERHGGLCGVPLGSRVPGLMMGQAGIGYGLLRLALPEEVPSVLRWERLPAGSSWRRLGKTIKSAGKTNKSPTNAAIRATAVKTPK